MRWLSTGFLLAVLTAACGGGGGGVTADGGTDGGMAGDGSSGAGDAAFFAPQFAAHRWLRVGSEAPLPPIGRVVELVHMTDPPAVVVEAGRARCVAGGASCLRAEYRNDPGENQVQTACFVCVDETGPCDGLPAAHLDLEAFAPAATRGDSDFLAHGQGRYYAVCSMGGRLRLGQSDVPLAPLMLRRVDAFGVTGPYSLSAAEMALTRDTSLVTLSGDVLRPPAMFVVGGSKPSGLDLRADGTATFADPPCGSTPECSRYADMLAPGDFLMIGHAFLDDGEAAALMVDTDLDDFVAAHGVMSWAMAASLSPEARRIVVERLLIADYMSRLVVFFDDLYAVRARKVLVGWKSYTPSRRRVMAGCMPSEQMLCDMFESEVATAEKKLVDNLLDAGFDLWSVNDLAFAADGSPFKMTDQPPLFSRFKGVLFDVSPSRPLDPGVDRTVAVVNAIQRLGKETAPLPVIVSPSASPVYFYVEGPQCEAEICRSDFTRYFALNEALFVAAADSLGTRLHAFAVGTFDGAHFDLRAPHETRSNLALNRVNSTGYNNPLLNLYLTR